jgi:hypothetical protein
MKSLTFAAAPTVVDIVSVEVANVVPFAKLSVAGLNDAVTPDAKAVGTERETPLIAPEPLLLTVTRNVADPAVPAVRVPTCEPTVTEVSAPAAASEVTGNPAITIKPIVKADSAFAAFVKILFIFNIY